MMSFQRYLYSSIMGSRKPSWSIPCMPLVQNDMQKPAIMSYKQRGKIKLDMLEINVDNIHDEDARHVVIATTGVYYVSYAVLQAESQMLVNLNLNNIPVSTIMKANTNDEYYSATRERALLLSLHTHDLLDVTLATAYVNETFSYCSFTGFMFYVG